MYVCAGLRFTVLKSWHRREKAEVKRFIAMFVSFSPYLLLFVSFDTLLLLPLDCLVVISDSLLCQTSSILRRPMRSRQEFGTFVSSHSFTLHYTRSQLLMAVCCCLFFLSLDHFCVLISRSHLDSGQEKPAWLTRLADRPPRPAPLETSVLVSSHGRASWALRRPEKKNIVKYSLIRSFLVS